MHSVDPKIPEISFPDFTLVSASAGSGKTHALTMRYVRLLLSQNPLRTILAITFTNNAAREMKQRILDTLKRTSLGDRTVVPELLKILPIKEEELKQKAAGLVDYLLENYSEFQVQTIDSFLARLFRASALEFGFAPSVEIVLDSSRILSEAFEQFTRNLSIDSQRRQILDRLIALLLDSQPAGSRYLWDPFAKLSEEVRGIYSALGNKVGEIQSDAHLLGRKKELGDEITAKFEELRELVRQSGLPASKNFQALVEAAQREDLEGFILRKNLYKMPVNKLRADEERARFEQWAAQFEQVQDALRKLANSYLVVSAQSYYQAYLEAHRYFQRSIENVMKKGGQATMADVNKRLAHFISRESVPEIYFYLGEQITHYLIDEFQDTSPLQWNIIRPLVEEALSKRGSLYLVGDMKQSIYTFRGADWKIMRRLLDGDDSFPSAPVQRETLSWNYRSRENIVNFSKEVFHRIVPSLVQSGAERLSGLSTFEQESRPGLPTKGYVEVFSIDEDADASIRKAKLLDIVTDCHHRGYWYGEMTILTPRNSDVIGVSGWLNERSIPFISHSSLDIRGRKITGELIALLRFLDSPIDDLSLATFLLGDVFRAHLEFRHQVVDRRELSGFLFKALRRKESSLYRAFRERYPELWAAVFEDLFNRVGYLPLYDLVSEMYKTLDISGYTPNEEGTLATLLEVIKRFEDRGQNSLKDFLEFSEEDSEDADWSIPAPRESDAVQVMTIHKAKGLDNRVVIVLLEDSLPHHENMFIQEDESGLHLLRIKKDWADADATLAMLYGEGEVRREVDDLNKLYVAFTRAKEEMYVISVQGERAHQPSIFLPQKGYAASAKPRVEHRDRPHENLIELSHLRERPPLQSVSPEKIGLYERKRGDFMHAILAKIEFLGPDIRGEVRKAAMKVRDESREHIDPNAAELRLVAFLSQPNIFKYFQPVPHRVIQNEKEFAQADGRLSRMDRVIADTNVVTVIDYKTGDEHEHYHEQVRTYMSILEDLYPGRAIRGILAFVDRGTSKEVELERA